METPKKSENNENRRIFYPRRNFWGSKKIMVWKHVPKVVKRQISFQYHMSQKKKGMFVLKNPSGAPLRGVLTCASLGRNFYQDSFPSCCQNQLHYVDQPPVRNRFEYKDKILNSDSQLVILSTCKWPLPWILELKTRNQLHSTSVY